MINPTTACRDPVFFRWHKFADDLLVLHKSKETPYTEDDLLFENIEVQNIGVYQVGFMIIEGQW